MSTCTDTCCRPGYEDGAPSYVRLRTERRRAAKMHRCADCGQIIDRGEFYYVIAEVIDGEFRTVKAHTDDQFCANYEPCDCVPTAASQKQAELERAYATQQAGVSGLTSLLP